MTVLDVAQAIGYASLSQFNVAFKGTLIVHPDSIEIGLIPLVFVCFQKNDLAKVVIIIRQNL